MQHIRTPAALPLTVLAAGLALLAPGNTRAAAPTTYKIQPIVKLGERAGDSVLPSSAGYEFFPGPVNDTGQVLFDVGGLFVGKPELLLLYDNGQFIPIAAPGLDSPIGKWPAITSFLAPYSMNQHGNAVFAPTSGSNGSTLLGTFLWEYAGRKLTAVALPGMPAVNGLVFTQAGGESPVINNRDEIVLVAAVKGSTGPAGSALFFRSPDGTLQPILVPGQTLPGGGKVQNDTGLTLFPSLNDAGVVAFLARRQGEGQYSAFLWEGGNITPALQIGAPAPVGGKITSVSRVFVNDKNRNVLLTAAVDGSHQHGVYLLKDGTLTPVAVPGQEMPDGGKLQKVQAVFSTGVDVCFGVSSANQAGQHVFLATLGDQSTAAYRVDTDGSVSLVVKSGAVTELGTVTSIGQTTSGTGSYGVGVNSQGQVVVSVRFDHGTPTLVLLTPAAP
jgi:hypothetical protein